MEEGRRGRWGRDRVLNMGRVGAQEELVAGKGCAQMSCCCTRKRISFLGDVNELNAYDWEHICNAIEIMDDLLGTSLLSSRNRLCGVNAQCNQCTKKQRRAGSKVRGVRGSEG